jgi:NAD(P)H-nitrite reductase large subunit
MVAEAIFDGAFTFEGLKQITDAGNGCTLCHPQLRECLQKYLAEAEVRNARRQMLALI